MCCGYDCCFCCCCLFVCLGCLFILHCCIHSGDFSMIWLSLTAPVDDIYFSIPMRTLTSMCSHISVPLSPSSFPWIILSETEFGVPLGAGFSFTHPKETDALTMPSDGAVALRFPSSLLLSKEAGLQMHLPARFDPSQLLEFTRSCKGNRSGVQRLFSAEHWALLEPFFPLEVDTAPAPPKPSRIEPLPEVSPTSLSDGR
jgi:hypothetical protein